MSVRIEDVVAGFSRMSNWNVAGPVVSGISGLRSFQLDSGHG